MQRLLCLRCGDSIHPDTAARNDGLCMPCVRGNQLSIEQRKEQRRQALEAGRARLESPAYKYWHTLVGRVYEQPRGFEALSHGDQLYYLINVLSGEVHNGGFDQFFSNSSGNRYAETVAALVEVDAQATLALLLEAKSTIFIDADVPVDRVLRYELMPTSTEEHPDYEAVSAALDDLDDRFYEDPDNLGEVLARIASSHNLYKRDS
jgi:Domain of unknown function (DUF4375)